MNGQIRLKKMISSMLIREHEICYEMKRQIEVIRERMKEMKAGVLLKCFYLTLALVKINTEALMCVIF